MISTGSNRSTEKELAEASLRVGGMLRLVEDGARNNRLDISYAVLPGLAASAGCVYRSRLWNGGRMFSLLAVNRESMESTRLTLAWCLGLKLCSTGDL